jgi:hypothetical protein
LPEIRTAASYALGRAAGRALEVCPACEAVGGFAPGANASTSPATSSRSRKLLVVTAGIVAASEYPVDMAETLSAEQVPARLAEIRDQLKLLADYL